MAYIIDNYTKSRITVYSNGKETHKNYQFTIHFNNVVAFNCVVDHMLYERPLLDHRS